MKKMLRKELLIGLTVLITLAILFFGIDFLKGINIFHPANYYYVTYTNVEGLTQSAPVTVNGFKVGLVREISYEYDNPGHVRVELSLDKELKVPRGSKAVLTTDMLGTASIELHMAPTDEFHAVGERLLGENSPSMLSKVGPAIDTLVPRIDSLLQAVTALASDPALTTSIHTLDRVMKNLETSTITLNHTLAPTPAITNNAALAMTDVKDIAANLNRISSDLAVVSNTLKEAPLDSTIRNFEAISVNLLALSKQLNNPNSSLGMLMNDPGLYNNLNAASAHIDSILVDLKRQPKRYIPSIKIF